jgi:hypothetical protein
MTMSACRAQRLHKGVHRSRGLWLRAHLRSCPNRGEVYARSSTVLDTQGAHFNGAVSRSVLHQRTAEIATSQAPGLGEITHSESDIRLRIGQFGWRPLEAHVGGCLGPDLHQANLADPSHRVGIVAALDANDRIGHSGRNTVGLRLSKTVVSEHRY